MQAKEKGNMLLVFFFLDFSKAFDTADHKHRLQYVTYHGSQSSQQLIKWDQQNYIEADKQPG